MATFAFSSDLHLTDRERDSYRWEFFPWFRKACEQRKVDGIFLLGDFTDRKDHHANRLLTQIAIELRLLAEIAPVWILKGNHDYIDPRTPFLRFITELNIPRIHFAWRVEARDIKGCRFWFLPHSRRPQEAWLKHNKQWRNHADFLLIHQSVIGAKVSNGTRMQDGLAARYFVECGVRDRCLILSGDIHVPQRIRKVVYVGSPYRVDFGDRFTPRVLFWKDGKLESLVTPMIRRVLVELNHPAELVQAKVERGDQVKIRMKLASTDFADWKELKQEVLIKAEQMGLQVFGVDLMAKGEARPQLVGEPVEVRSKKPVDLLEAFCKVRKVDASLLTLGKEILEDQP